MRSSYRGPVNARDVSPLGHVAVLSLEPWDAVMRRNQHFATRLVSSGAAERLTFVEPVTGGLTPSAKHRRATDRITVLTPPLLVPRRYGGHRLVGRWLRHELQNADLLWINDPVVGAASLRPGQRAVYDVTDDWRSMPQPSADRARAVAGEDALARSVPTVVCSCWLATCWRERYDVDAVVVQNGVDVQAIRAAAPRELPGPGPHAIYVGTAHPSRMDTGLLVALAESWPGTVHLVGPTELGLDVQARLQRNGAMVHGPVASAEVPGWLVSADVLICPHRVDEFTLSLDAIKSHEYLATSCPVVATPSSGFQELSAPGLVVVPADEFVRAATDSLGTGPWPREVAVDWDERAAEFAAALDAMLETQR